MPPEMLRLCALALQAATVSAGLGDLLGGIIDTLKGGGSDGGAGAGAGLGAVAIASASAAPLTEPKCADNLAAGASDLCQPRFVWGLRNGGPQSSSSNAGASPAEGGKGGSAGAAGALSSVRVVTNMSLLTLKPNPAGLLRRTTTRVWSLFSVPTCSSGTTSLGNR